MLLPGASRAMGMVLMLAITPPRHPPAVGVASHEEPSGIEPLKELFRVEKQKAAQRKAEAEATQKKLSTLGAVRDMWPMPPRLQPHDIPVVTLEGRPTAAALEQLLKHQCCAVHVKGFMDAGTCSDIVERLSGRRAEELFSNWNIHRSASSDAQASLAPTEVFKVGTTSGEALETMEAFEEYLTPDAPASVEALLPGTLNPFTTLRHVLDELHPEGCRRSRLGEWVLPAGTFRRMMTSKGLVHADTATLLSDRSGEFSANLYIRTPDGRGALSIYPAMQYASALTSPMLVADLQSLALKQSAGFDPAAQEALRAALPLKKTIELEDGDLVLINTGRFHGVEPYGEGAAVGDEPELRLSGQCWLSYREGSALRMWV